jgi:hypothetical protein
MMLFKVMYGFKNIFNALVFIRLLKKYDNSFALKRKNKMRAARREMFSCKIHQFNEIFI